MYSMKNGTIIAVIVLIIGGIAALALILNKPKTEEPKVQNEMPPAATDMMKKGEEMMGEAKKQETGKPEEPSMMGTSEKEESTATEMGMEESKHAAVDAELKKEYEDALKKAEQEYDAALKKAMMTSDPSVAMAQAKTTYEKAKADAKEHYKKEREESMKKAQ